MRPVHTIHFGDNLDILRRHVRGRLGQPHLHRPAVQYRQGAVAHAHQDRAEASGRSRGLPGAALRDRQDGLARLPRPLRRLPGLPRAAPAGGPPGAGAGRHALLPHRLPRGALLQGAAGRHLRAAIAFSTRSSGPTTTAGARRAGGRPSTTTFWSTSRTRRATSSTPRPSSASRTWRRGWSGRRRRRAASFPPTRGGTPSCRRNGRERTGYPTQKPLGVVTPHRAGVLASGRPRARLFRRQRHHRRGLPRDATAASSCRRQPGSARRHGASLRRRPGHPLGRLRSRARSVARRGAAPMTAPRCLTLPGATASIRHGGIHANGQPDQDRTPSRRPDLPAGPGRRARSAAGRA